MEECEENKQQNEESSDSVKAVSAVPTKTWGFRRTTIARREFMEEIGNLNIKDITPRRQTRGRGRGQGRGQASQAPVTSPSDTRRLRGRRSARAHLEATTLSQTPPDEETTSETSLDRDIVDVKGTLEKMELTASPQQPVTEEAPKVSADAVGKDDVSDRAEDSDDLTLKEVIQKVKNRHKHEESRSQTSPELQLDPNLDEVSKDTQEVKENAAPKQAKCRKKSAQTKQNTEEDMKKCKVDEESLVTEGTSVDSSSEACDPNALYCICRQKHNKRFMICCDRCHEWFHGDCVGITEARGRLLEENGEDYICPKCSPSQSPVQDLIEPVLLKFALKPLSDRLASASSEEDKPCENQGIKGKIRKASGLGNKKKIKIFHSVKLFVVFCLQRHHFFKLEREVKEEEDGSPLPLCIGLGCGKNALPDSVYCGHECILQHAAVAMQSLSEPKAKPDIQAKVTTNPAPQGWRKSLPGTLSQRKLTEPPIDKGEELEEDAVAEKQETDAAPVSSESEHKATAAPQMAAITSSVFYKSCMYLPGILIHSHIHSIVHQHFPEFFRYNQIFLAVKEREKVESSTDPNTLHSQCLPQSTTPSDGSTDDKIRPAPSVKKLISNPAAGRAKKTMPGSPRLSAARQQLMGSVQVSKSTKKDSPRSDAPAHLSHTISSSATEVRNLPVSPAPLPPTGSLETHPNIQIRQNIRRSLTEILLERVSNCENLEMPESEIGKLAQNIEKEIFNMYFTTDQKYKNKYRSLMFNLKDHKNKGLLSQVIKGEISPFKLSRLSQQELQSRELWDTSHSTEAPTSNSQPKPALREEHSQSVDTKESSLVSERELSKSDCPPRASDTSSTSEAKVPTNKAAQLKKSSSSVLDLLSSMLKDTTSEHRTHLFDLKCRICTGQISADEEPPPKKSKKAEQKESEEAATPQIVHTVEENPEPAPSESVSPLIIESPASPVAEHSSAEIASPEFAPVVIPGVSTMSVTGRDPRTMAYRPAPSSKVIPAASSTQTQMPPVKETISEAKPMQPLHPPLPPPPTIPKSILMKPSSSSVSRFTSSSGSSSRSLTSHVPADRETSQFLSKQDTVWKGFLNMQTVAKFVTKGYLISGSADYLKEDLPDTIHIGGRIMPQMVWDYVDRLKTSPTKELCMIRFHPATEEEEVAYVSLFSYFNSRRRFGVVSNICSHIKDLYLIPLSAKESIPSILLPFEGPGLEQNRPNLLIGLVICQKTKRPGALSQEVEEKRPKIEILQDPKIASLPTPPEVPKPDIRLYGSQSMELEIPSSTTPPGSPPHTGSPDSDNSLSSPSTLTGFMSVIKAPNSVRLDHGKISHPSSSSEAESPSTSTPLQTILTTLFGRKNQDPEATVNVSKPSSSTDSEPVASSTTHNDPIVQQYQHTLNEPMMETLELDYDRPYDPEEEYNPALRYGTLTPVRPPEDFEGKTLSAVEQIADSDDNRPYDPEEEYSSAGPAKASEINTAPLESAVNDDIAYDPEDESIFEEMKNNLAGNTKSSNSDYGISSTATLSEQQKMLEELNKQIEEQKRQLEQQEEALRLQKAAVGMSMAHFSVSDALMSPPRTPSLDNYQAFQFGREAEEKAIKTTDSSIIDQSRDPRQSRDAKKAILSISQNFVTESCEREKSDQTEKSSQSGSHNSSVQVAFQFESEIQSAKSKTIMDTKERDNASQGEPEQFHHRKQPPLGPPRIWRSDLSQGGDDKSECRGQRPPHPEMSQDSGPSQNIGPRWPCPGQFEGHSYPPDNCFERQNDSPQLRYDGPPPRFNESGPRGPPHGRFENRFPSPPHFDGPRGFTSQQCKKPGSHPPKQRGANNHVFFDTDSCSSQEGEIRPLREPSPPHLLRQNQPCQQDSSEEHRHPVERDLQGPHQFEEYKGQNMQRGQRGPHFGKHDKFEHGRGFVRGGGRGAFGFRGQQAPSPHFHGQRMPSPQHRGSFEDQNNPHSSGFHNQLGPPQHNRPRGPSPGQFQNKRGQLRPSFDGPNIRPLRHSGPLLPTPTQGPIQMLSPLGQGLDAHQECSWPQEKLPSTRWGSDSRENLKALKSGERLKNAGSEDPSSPVQGR
ncbi:death-inducer obliterator 1 [Chanos chanos]|uniref:Death-inducer obliterator 1 n=1 Tax=Chanos chanos TaxID=29144 RepID=A0A6J2UVD1_CHACN|nr:death-inducer obliterator 1-like [Chanos chanos]